MMKAAVYSQTNHPWEIKKVAIPEPQEDQVLIKVHASGVCGTDLHITHGLMPQAKTPLIMGHEPVGEVVKVGPGVKHLKIGDRVGVSWHQKGCGHCPYCQNHKALYCNGLKSGPITWMNLGGGHAEYTVAYEDGCTQIPDKLSYELAAPLFCAGFTVSSGYQNATPRPGDVIAVLGVGGLGHLAIQLAKAKGHKVIAVTEHEDKKDLCISMGADEVIIGSKNLGFSLLSLGGVDIILDTSNNNALVSSALLGLRPEGRCVIMGIDGQPLEVNTLNLIHTQSKIIGSTQNHRSDLIDILKLAEQGKVKPMIEVYDLEQANEVLERLKNKKVRFRAVFKLI